MKRDAEITVGADASAVERAAASAKAAWRDVGQSLTSALGSAAQGIATNLAEVAAAQGKVNFSSQHQQVRELESATARLATATGRDLESVRSAAEATGKAIGKRPGEVTAWTSSVGQLAYSYKGVEESLRGVSALAAETGRTADDYRGLAVTLSTVGHAAGSTTHAIGVMHAQADEMGTVGGISAFADQVEALGDTVSRFAGSSEKDFLKVTGLAAELGKGLSPAAAGRVQQGAFGALAADPLRWERYLGRSITDEHGRVEDPAKVMQELTEKTKRRYGKDARRVMMLNFGAETGAAMFNADFEHAAQSAGLAPSAKPGAAQQKLIATDAGQRGVAEAELAASSRSLLGSSTALGRAADGLQKFSANNPLTGTFAAAVASTTLSGFLSKYGGSISTMMGGRGGGAVGGVVDLATQGKRAPVGGLGSLGAAAGIFGAALAAKEAGAIGADLGSGLAKQAGGGKHAQGAGTFFGAASLGTMLLPGAGALIGAMELYKERSRGDAAPGSAPEKPVKITIINSTGGPVEVAEQGRNSAAAGSQAHG